MADDGFDDYLKQRIEAAFGLDALTPEEQAYWDAYDCACEARRRLDETFVVERQRAMKELAAEINARPEILEPYVPGIGAVIAEHELRFVWEAAP